MASAPYQSELSPRAHQLLKTLVVQYIRDGHPVGSRTLSRDSGLDVSAATIRNVMADLEEMGLIAAPHTSAGRVPTVQGYRLFVDTMLTMRPPAAAAVQRARAALADDGAERGAKVELASGLLSDFTSMAGMVTLPRIHASSLRQVEFLPLSDQRVLVILVKNDHDVENRIIHTSRRYTATELQQAGRYLSEAFAGTDPLEVRERLVRELGDAREHMNRMMQVTVEIAEQAFVPPTHQDDFIVAGQINLMDYGELSDVEKLRELFEAFNRKRDILHLLDQSMTAQGVQLFIGEESGYEMLDDCSVVTAPYTVDGQRVGVLGVVGPTRMNYERVIPIVDMTARLLGDALNTNH
jgi:heat-inducible transcriptional repressor